MQPHSLPQLALGVSSEDECLFFLTTATECWARYVKACSGQHPATGTVSTLLTSTLFHTSDKRVEDFYVFTVQKYHFFSTSEPNHSTPHFLAHRYLGLALLIPNLHLKSTLILVFSLPSTPKWGRAKRGRKATPLQSPLEHDQCPLVHLTVTKAGRPGSFPTNFLMD